MVYQYFFYYERICGIFFHIFSIYLYFLFCNLSGGYVIYKMFLTYNLRQDTKAQKLKEKMDIFNYIKITNFYIIDNTIKKV